MPTNSEKRIVLKSLAMRLATAWKENNFVEESSVDEVVKNRADAYFVQDAMSDILGYSIEGWKIGAASAKMREKEGHDGIVTGRLYGVRTYSGTTPEIDGEQHPAARVEAEFGLRLTRDILPEDPTPSHDDLGRITVAFIAVEIIGNRYLQNGNYKPSTLAAISDNGGASGAVLGRNIDNADCYDYLSHPITLRVNGGGESGNLSAGLRAEPLDALAQLCAQMRDRKIALRAGQVILTGGATVPANIAPGDRVSADFGPMGKIAFSLANSTRSARA